MVITSGQELALHTVLTGGRPTAPDIADLEELTRDLHRRHALRAAIDAAAAGAPPPTTPAVAPPTL